MIYGICFLLFIVTCIGATLSLVNENKLWLIITSTLFFISITCMVIIENQQERKTVTYEKYIFKE